MEEDVVHNKSMDRPTTRESQGEYSPNKGMLHNRSKGLDKVNTRALSETTKNSIDLVALKRTICLKLHFNTYLPMTTLDRDG
jgi:hypothetical protein